ncbi:MAG: hypothetical protein FJ398_20325 [Verrucomicrobia bacterium]|nr:hypothetical protein [Verrucomicrobiota bacterium]
MSEKAESFGPWTVGELPPPPRFGLSQWRAMIGPGILMAGANIGGGEWLLGPEVTARYGGSILWIATLAIAAQVFFNLEVMRYALYCGEPMFVGYFRLPPGPVLWTGVYLAFDFIGVWPYLASNAAVPFAAIILGRLPTETDATLVRGLSYVVFLGAYLPVLFGRKIYNALQFCMIVKAVLVLGYLLVINLIWNRGAWGEAVSGLFKFGMLPPTMDWATVAAFAGIAGAGGLSNMQFSNYVREKGWGMGGQVGAIPSAFGGKTIKLSHVGKVFPVTPENLERWRGWYRHIVREQLIIWVPAVTLGAILPAMLSLGFLPRGTTVKGWEGAAMTAKGLAEHIGPAFWYLTLTCGLLVLAPTQITQMDGMVRRWVDVLWTGSRRLLHLDGNKVKYVYYSVLAVYGLWGMIALAILNPAQIVKTVANFWNLALGFSAVLTVVANRRLLPKELRPRWFMELGALYCAAFYLGIFGIVAYKEFFAAD